METATPKRPAMDGQAVEQDVTRGNEDALSFVAIS